MTVAMRQGVIVLEGTCPAGDAEELLQLLLSATANVDWRTCDAAHTSVIQVLMAAGCRMIGPPRGEVLASIVAPALSRGRE
ncbi:MULTISPECIES: hypothetical protein [Rhodopseudomonas]|uniref:Uncharacterized protein n=1 Tax=Rhodopseudomonas palustris TaxID=1076 RepID=A0A0D7ES79_RHOPL|nr:MULTISPECIES: hypothetical protein [Rhodopseudomonas]KIZ43526.1 hypothetical protein OO17_11125 [Rhodopseudomonas palustris]MDF3809094.1 hypothetical protein [Rhodopseudomonas sp. BAL398]WOK16413.1 hypothetical protein RBJ75_19930 [Rhodopseudomonas sp. BAL398]